MYATKQHSASLVIRKILKFFWNVVMMLQLKITSTSRTPNPIQTPMRRQNYAYVSYFYNTPRGFIVLSFDVIIWSSNGAC